eukprot:7381360-Prymnesium_polylepis.2
MPVGELLRRAPRSYWVVSNMSCALLPAAVSVSSHADALATFEHRGRRWSRAQGSCIICVVLGPCWAFSTLAELLPPQAHHVRLLCDGQVGGARGVDVANAHKLVHPVAILLHTKARVNFDDLWVEPAPERLNERIGCVNHAKRGCQPHSPRVR